MGQMPKGEGMCLKLWPSKALKTIFDVETCHTRLQRVSGNEIFLGVGDSFMSDPQRSEDLANKTGPPKAQKNLVT